MIPYSLALLFITGIVFGSFISVLIFRLHTGKKGILWGKSVCPHCDKKLRATELIPLISYLLQRGKCKKCKKNINWHYPVLELSTGLIFMAIGLFSLNPLWLFLIYGFLLTFIFFYDLLYMEIPDEIMIPAILIAALGCLHPATITLSDGALGALLLTGFFLAQILISKGKWLGGGDLRIGAFMGFILGLQATLIAIFSAYLIGSIVSITLIASGKASRKSMIPFGPFLVIGTFVALFYGKVLVDWYLNFIYL